ncbi:MAG: hypothetical protein ACE15F_22030 [bacterium]
MNIAKVGTIITLLAFSLMSHSQPIILNNENVEFTQIAHIDKDAGLILKNELSNIKTIWTNSSASDRGDLIVSSSKLLKMKNQFKQINDLPVLTGHEISNPHIDTENNMIIYSNMTDEFHVIFQFYDFLQEKNKDIFSISGPPAKFYEKSISRNGATIALQVEYTTASDKYLHLYSKNYVSDNYSKTELGPFSGLFKIMVSKNGERVFCYVCHYTSEGNVEDDYKYVYITKTPEGWSDEILIPGAEHFINQKSEKILIFPEAIANDGKTIVARTNKNTLVLIHESNGHWSDPEYVGDINPPVSSYFPFHVSDDARVIAIQQPRILIPGNDTYITYDAIVFIKDRTSQWKKYQVNPKGTDILDGIVLSTDGSKLYWVPASNLSFLYYPDMK